MVFSYNEREFIFQTSWTEPRSSFFDVTLRYKWQSAVENGCFRYNLNILECKYLPGKYSFLAQLNPDRATNRRPPEDIQSLSQPFDNAKFNFNKISEKEILFEVKKSEESESSSDTLAINVSPLEYGHSLLIPNRIACLPQVVTLASLERIVDLILLSGSPAIRAGFNSLCGYATVNHLHFHLYYLQYSMLLERIPLKNLCGPCHTLMQYPAKGFVFLLDVDHNVSQLASSVYKLTNYLQCKDIAHNVFITRGCSFERTTDDSSILDTVRIYVWARKHSPCKISGLDPALCELFGHLVVKEEDLYPNITESWVAGLLTEICEEPFAQNLEAVKLLFEETAK